MHLILQIKDWTISSFSIQRYIELKSSNCENNRY